MPPARHTLPEPGRAMFQLSWPVRISYPGRRVVGPMAWLSKPPLGSCTAGLHEDGAPARMGRQLPGSAGGRAVC